MSPPQPEAEAPTGSEAASGAGARRRRLGLATAALLLGIAMLAILLRSDEEAPPEVPEGWVLFADIDGWYRHTPAEVAVRARYDLRLEGITDALPLRLGPWRGEERERFAFYCEHYDVPEED